MPPSRDALSAAVRAPNWLCERDEIRTDDSRPHDASSARPLRGRSFVDPAAAQAHLRHARLAPAVIDDTFGPISDVGIIGPPASRWRATFTAFTAN